MLEELKQRAQALELVPAGGGCFEVTVDGDLIWSKLATGDFPEPEEILETLLARLDA